MSPIYEAKLVASLEAFGKHPAQLDPSEEWMLFDVIAHRSKIYGNR